MRKTLTLAVAAAGVATLALTAGCGSQWDQTHNRNTPVGPYVARPNVIIQFPYGWDNISRACVDGDGVYVGFHGSQATVVPNDPACKNAPAGK